MNKTIIEFISEQTCASLCCVDEAGKPYCFSCYYAIDVEAALLYFKSSGETHHSKLLKKNPQIAGTILPDKLSTFIVKGLQLDGDLLADDHPMAHKASVFYHKKHPMALAVNGNVWTIKINNIKMTDSTLGFGKKIVWERVHEELVNEREIVNNLSLN